MAVYACSDFHGCLKYYKAIKEFLKPEDKVYFLGDAGDRGPEPWETIKAVARDPQFVYIKGNHEDMLAVAIQDAIKGEDMYSYRVLINNGGTDTFEQAMAEEDPAGWAHHLEKLSPIEKYMNENGEVVFLCHAGFTPWLNVHNTEVAIPNEDRLIWDREHFYEDYEDYDWLPNAVVVHGHTPIPYLWDDFRIPEEKQTVGAFWYANGHKVDIDTGAVWTGHCVLLDLDTWEEHIFEVE